MALRGGGVTVWRYLGRIISNHIRPLIGLRVSGDLSDIGFTLLSFNPCTKTFIRSRTDVLLPFTLESQ